MKKVILTSICLICFHLSYSQKNTFSASLETTGISGNREGLPFWFTSNNLGKYSPSASWQWLTEGQLSGYISIRNRYKVSYGTDITLSVSDKNTEAKIIQAWAGFAGKTLSFKAGNFADEVILGGLSSSNGNIVRSLNFRPYPMVRLSTSGYIPFLFAKKWLRFKASYDEGILLDDRIDQRPHLHHTLLGGQFLINKTLKLSLEIDRFAFWGGKSSRYGQLPDDFGSYFRYILGIKGSSKFVEGDQNNVAGNQIGSYTIFAEKDLSDYQLQLRISHPFEDGSGMELLNFRDNIYSLYLSKNKSGSIIDELLFEYMYTKHQSGSSSVASGRWNDAQGRDDYFNHSVYQTGFSYYGYSMGSPLFYPLVRNADGIVSGFGNNRISAFHVGAKGYVSKQIAWKTLLTYSRNFGTYSKPYTPLRKQFCSLAEFIWKSEKYPLSVSGQFAADFGELLKDQFGFGLKFKWQIN